MAESEGTGPSGHVRTVLALWQRHEPWLPLKRALKIGTRDKSPRTSKSMDKPSLVTKATTSGFTPTSVSALRCTPYADCGCEAIEDIIGKVRQIVPKKMLGFKKRREVFVNQQHSRSSNLVLQTQIRRCVM
jgi:hypothetical protein